ncbi:MAG: TAT-variant-translocated molybdopterin oxidoreductase [Chthoniobacteraceae bacterium]
MKRILQHPAEPATGKKYWRSLGQLSGTPEFKGWLEREFPQGAAEFNGGETTRRNFLQLMGASMALAGLSFAGCRRPEKHLVPFTRGVEWSIPGKALFFATAFPTRKGAAPLVVQTHDGRPTKIEGNPAHPVSKGATDLLTQASILDLYDPDRSRYFLSKGELSDSAAFEKGLDDLIKGAGDGTGLAFLLEDVSTPSRERLRGLIAKKFPKATWTVYEPLGAEAAGVFGPGIEAVPAIEKADVILTLDHDFLGTDGDVATSRAFSSRRAVTGPDSKMNRLYAVENRYTVTGGIADHRLRLPASQVGAFAVALATEIASVTKDAALDGIAKAAKVPAAKINPDWVKYSAEDLVANKGKSLVLAGPRQPAAVQFIAAAMNAALGNLGKTLVGRKVAATASQNLPQLAKQIADKSVKALVIVGGNPAYNAPADLEWEKLQASVPTVVRVGFYEDETSLGATWHAPLAHYLESWGDGRAADGSYVSVQPMILPLYGAWSENDVLAKFAGLAKPAGPELVQETFKAIAKPADLTTAWAKFLHDGFLEASAALPQALTFNAAAATQFVSPVPAPAATGDNTYEIVFIACPKVDDGRFNNNGWLQEIPDPISKLTWDNAALISPATAKKLGVAAPDRHMTVATIEVKIGNNILELPALISPGHADNSVSVALGYGRTRTGRVGTSVGFDAYKLRTTATPYFAVGAGVRVTGKDYQLAVTQEHGVLEGRGADLTREATLGEYKDNRENKEYFKKMGMDAHGEKNVSLYTNPPLNKPESIDPHAWGMTVDLNVCTGCSACMVACQAENNIPIVGKRQVIDGREMHWIRTDRYFASEGDADLDDPELVSQPMMCQHCENAPCETVCPVNATVHSEDGLNVMAYNRCIGTRYCANNCPFKVRRFNFFDYNQRKLPELRKWNLLSEKGMEDSLKLQKNPNVTVRMRGVMEKCTFCVQRIQEAKIATKVAVRDSGDVRIPADAFTSACAQVCPTGAITFGDINNPESSVSKIRASERGYRLLEYLNVNSRVTYLARIRNPNMKMPGAEKIGAAMKSHHGHSEKHEGAAQPGAHS